MAEDNNTPVKGPLYWVPDNIPLGSTWRKNSPHPGRPGESTNPMYNRSESPAPPRKKPGASTVSAVPAYPEKVRANGGGGVFITITDIKLISSYTTTVASYNILTPSENLSVWRKHADFAWLRQLLRDRYPGMLVPSIPAKLQGSATMSLCEPRKRLLRLFVDRLGKDVLLQADPIVKAFLSVADDAEWATLMKTTVATPAAGQPGTRAQNSWVEKSAAAAPSETEADTLVAEYRARFAVHEKHLAKLAASAVAVAAAAVQLNKAVRKCAERSATYQGDETGMGGPAGQSLAKSLSRLGTAFEEWGVQSSLGPAVLNEVLKTGVTYELQQVQAFNELLKTRDAKAAELAKKRKTLAGHEKAKESGQTETKKSMFGMATGAAPKSLDAVIDDHSESVKDLEKDLSVLNGALVGSQFKKFDLEMMEAYEELVGMVSVGMLKVQSHGNDAWTTALEGTDQGFMTQKITTIIPDYEDYGARHKADTTADETEEDAAATS
mmetsp:Transcript_66034/g.149039  ORF Transcript_66034/g.149039 Transcript_66034/m.149039 type:complete len:495 (-) Transcript_66034:52-1536(-)